MTKQFNVFLVKRHRLNTYIAHSSGFTHPIYTWPCREPLTSRDSQYHRPASGTMPSCNPASHSSFRDSFGGM
jgi:hypothetical protein